MSKLEKKLKQTVKRINKSKDEIASDIAHARKVAHIKDVVREIFPKVAEMESIYDAQTVVNALSGFIEAHIEKKLGDIKLSEITIDLSKEEDSAIKTAMIALIESFQAEGAKELAETLERFGRTLSSYGADKFLKNPMNTITIDDILAK